ncbi:MAG: acyl-CoA dehydrogenase family protein [Dehalococcoidia bacterium]|nr:acyl-CoA dehydrogenase family protein [Dehalococcoidia bacterium]
MDFKFTQEQERFRKEVRDFLEGEIEKGIFETRANGWVTEENEAFVHHLAERGWLGMTWPQEYGGQGRSYLDRLILTEEMMHYGAPGGGFLVGDRQIGPSIMAHGTEEQRDFFLPRIVRGETSFAIGISEPQAGSDVGALETRAVEEGDSFVISGQKVWTSNASRSDFIYLIARTNFAPEVSRYRSISEFIVDLKTPGITINPLMDMAGHGHWCEVFFDDVQVPGTTLIGKKDMGFYQIMSQLDYERAGVERLMGNYPLLRGIIDYTKETKRDGVPLCKQPRIRYMLSDLMIKFEVGKLLVYRVAWLLNQKEKPTLTRDTCIAKVYGNRFEQELDNAAMNIAGLHGQLDSGSKCAILDGAITRAYLFSPAHSIQGGTSEILMNIIADRGLGLPRK